MKKQALETPLTNGEKSNTGVDRNELERTPEFLGGNPQQW